MAQVAATPTKTFGLLLDGEWVDTGKRVDVIVSPTVPAFPAVVGEVWVQSGDLPENVIDSFLRFNITYDLTGFPAISLPCGFSSAGLPIGLQIAGRAFEETTTLKVAHGYEQATDWHRARPALD